MKIVLTGSLGHIGKPLAEMLVKEHSVTVISSNTERKNEIENLGAQPAIGSVTDTSFLRQTFRDADAVFCMTPPNFTAPDQLDYYGQNALCYADAIRQSGVKRVVYLSSYGAHLPSGTGLILGSHHAEKILDEPDGISLTHVRPTYFYYNLLAFIPMIRSAGFIGAVYGSNDKLAMVAPSDIAYAIAEELTKTKDIRKVRYVNSDDRHCNDVAKVLGAAIGKPDLSWQILPEEQVLQALLSTGMPENVAVNLIELGKAIHSGALRDDFEKNIPVAGRVTLEDYAAEFAAIYNQQIEN